MIRRREMILAGLGLSALGLAEALKPRNKMKLLKPGGTIEAALPSHFGTWVSQAADLVSPAQAGRLATSLYSETVGRAYLDEATGEEVFVLAAYGDTQSDLLQLHRPGDRHDGRSFRKYYLLDAARRAAAPERR
jgi:proline racemase